MMRRRVKQSLIAALVLLAFTLEALSSTDRVMVSMDGTSIDWTGMQVTAVGSVRVDKDALSYPSKLQDAYLSARTAAKHMLYLTLLRLAIDRMQDLKTLLINRDSMRHRIQNHVFSRAFEIVPPYQKGGRVFCTWRLKLTGSSSLYTMLPALYPFFSIPPKTVFVYKGGYNYTGLVIDARHLNISPSAGMKIFNRKGMQLYGPSFTDRFRFVQQGHILYLPTFTSPLLRRRAGQRFLYLHAASAKTRTGSDLVLFDRDADRILASENMRKALKQCRVVVICRSRKRK